MPYLRGRSKDYKDRKFDKNYLGTVSNRIIIGNVRTGAAYSGSHILQEEVLNLFAL